MVGSAWEPNDRGCRTCQWKIRDGMEGLVLKVPARQQ